MLISPFSPLVRLLHSIILVTDVLSNVTFRSFAFEFPWAFGYAALSSYVFGIAHTMSEVSTNYPLLSFVRGHSSQTL